MWGGAGISETQGRCRCRRVRGGLHPRRLQDVQGARRGRGITGKRNTIFLNRKQHWGAGSRQSRRLRTSASCPQGTHGTWNAVPTGRSAGQGATWLLAPVSWAWLTLVGDRRSCCVGPRGLATEAQAGTQARPRLRLDTQQARVPRGAQAFQKGFPAQSPEATSPAPSCARLSTGSPQPPENASALNPTKHMGATGQCRQAVKSQGVGMPQALTVPTWRAKVVVGGGVPPATLLQSQPTKQFPQLKIF